MNAAASLASPTHGALRAPRTFRTLRALCTSRARTVAAWLALSALVTACGGGGDEAATDRTRQPLAATAPPATAALPQRAARAATPVQDRSRGTLQAATMLRTVLASEVSAAVADPGSRLPSIAPAYDVVTWRLEYWTVDGQGQPILASGLLALPKKARGAPSPIISYQHGTIFLDAEAPSNNATATEPSVVMASLGYVVGAADYVGYGVSRGAPHPYLLAAPTAAAVVDLLYAGGSFAARYGGIVPNGQLFLVGYSEGGYATAAAHREIQRQGGDFAEALVGSAPGGGPLDVGATLDELFRRVQRENAALRLINPDLLQNLGGALRNRVRDELLKKLLPGNADVVFQSTFIDNFLANNRGAINRDSDVHDWRPDKAVRLFHGRDDQTVPYIGSESALLAMQRRGAPNVLLTDCTAVPAGHLQCVPPYWSFMLTQMGFVVRDL